PAPGQPGAAVSERRPAAAAVPAPVAGRANQRLDPLLSWSGGAGGVLLVHVCRHGLSELHPYWPTAGFKQSLHTAAGPVGRTAGMLLMASMVTGRSLSPMVRGIAGLLPVPTWVLQGSVDLPNHEAGSGRPVTTEAMDMRCYTHPHRFYCGVDLHG